MASGSLIPNSNGSRVKLNFKGMQELMKSPEIQAVLHKRMTAVQAAVPGSELDIVVGKRRARGVVAFGSDFDEANTGNLSRALDLASGSRGIQH